MIDFSQLAVSIDAERNGAIVMIRPHIENPQPLTLQYRLSVRQSSAGGESNINQQGDIQTGASANTISLNVPTGARCQVHLEIYQDAALVKAVDRACEDPAAQ